MPPTFDANSFINLAERTQYEAWVLEAAYKLVEDELFPSWPDGVIYPANQPPVFYGHASGNVIVGDWRPKFLDVGAPLILVSTFKLIDMLMEWVLDENGIPSTFRFQQKQQHLHGSPIIFPPFIESRVWLKERLIGLYDVIEPFRGTIIHDRHFTSVDGMIRVSSSKNGVVGNQIEISPSQLRTLVRTIVSVIKYVDGTWQYDEFREKTLGYDLDQLTALHGQPPLGQNQPFHTCVRVYFTGSDPRTVDLATIRHDLATHYANKDCSFDIRVLRVRDSTVHDAYFFPWTVCSVPTDNDLWHISDLDSYRTEIPGDIDIRHIK